MQRGLDYLPKIYYTVYNTGNGRRIATPGQGEPKTVAPAAHSSGGENPRKNLGGYPNEQMSLQLPRYFRRLS